jgi:hypothetical protein
VVAERLRASGHLPLATILVMLFGFQIALGAVGEVQRLRAFGATAENVIPLDLLASIRTLPASARLAYSCGSRDEVAPWEPSLISIEAHTGRPVVPMCFEADVHSPLFGAEPLIQIPDADFAFAPQRALYPDVAADPSSTAVRHFLKEHDIDYIYADARHPNSLVDNAVPIASSGSAEILQIP